MIFTVDACVLRASSSRGIKPAAECRAALMGIAQAKARVVGCPLLAAEWKRHASRFGVAWLAQMRSRGLLRLHEPNEVHKRGVDLAMDGLPLPEKKVASKDAHLVITAISFDAVVLSLEIRSRNVFHLIVGQYAPLAQVVWLNPDKHDPYVVPFIRGECAAFADWRLIRPDL